MSSNDRERWLIASTKKDLFLGGAWQASESGKTFPVEDPSSKVELCQVADAGPDDARLALASAASAQKFWGSQPPDIRAEILRRTHALLMERQEEIALLITLENGKPLAESRAEVGYGAGFFRWFAEEALRIDGRYTVAPNGTARFLVMKQPVGPCLLVTPWNFPLAMGCRKIAPALAAGCTMIVKPAEQTPLTMLALAALLVEAGLPPGVVNVITTSDPGSVVEPLVSDSRLRKLSFTGSTEVGRQLMRQSAENLLRLSLELGGNAPFLVFDDADIEQAVSGALVAKMRNAGQTCVAANRFYVHESIAEPFTRLLALGIDSLRIGRGVEEGVSVGPLIDISGKEKVDRLLAEALDRGAQIANRPQSVALSGYYSAPTVLSNVHPESDLLHEEIFGPVAPVVTFRTDDEAIAAANGTANGLVSYFYTKDLSRAMRTAEALEAGMIGINRGSVSEVTAPFGGIKHSGFGREGGEEGIMEYLQIKYAAITM